MTSPVIPWNLPLACGYLTIETLKGILLELEPNLGEDQLLEIVEEVDEDGSGTIDYDGKYQKVGLPTI